jgi:hypothetical protein
MKTQPTARTKERAPATSTKARVIRLPKEQESAKVELRDAIQTATRAFRLAVADGDKDYLRALHLEAKRQQPGVNASKVHRLLLKHKHHFKSGHQIDPAKIKPVLHLADEPLWSDLFKITRALWSMPYNKGYGRRLRFVVYDEFHEAVIGIIGLQSPPADLTVRDRLFEYPESRKLELVNSTMDAYAVGAIPPYSYLLGGKLCAGLISSDTVRQIYWRQYAGKKTEMLDAGIQQPLAAVTTTSAFGRSSQYNRLKYRDRLLAEPIGYTAGFGTLHLEHLYERVAEYLKEFGTFTKGGYGNGPKVRWQNITRVLLELELPKALLRHGMKREVFLYRFTDDLESGMKGGSFGTPLAMTEAEFGSYWRERWAMPRATSRPTWNQGEDLALLEQAILLPVRDQA